MNISDQRIAVANLVTYCERMIDRGHLPALDETNLRYFVNETCTAFDMAPVRDRNSSNVEAA